MKLYRPEDKINFGQYKGEEMRFIYTFDPKYVEWLIIMNAHFVIAISDFKDRHTYQIDIMDTTQRLGTVMVEEEGIIRNLSLRKYLKEFFTSDYELNYISTPEKINKFHFSDRALSILKNKIERINSLQNE